jgi:hypothetical protein
MKALDCLRSSLFLCKAMLIWCWETLKAALRRGKDPFDAATAAAVQEGPGFNVVIIGAGSCSSSYL